MKINQLSWFPPGTLFARLFVALRVLIIKSCEEGLQQMLLPHLSITRILVQTMKGGTQSKGSAQRRGCRENQGHVGIPKVAGAASSTLFIGAVPSNRIPPILH